MNKKILATKAVSLACAMLLGSGMGLAQMTQSTPGSPASQTPNQTPGMNSPQMNGMQQATGQASPTDRMFVSTALKGGMAEVLGQLTLQKSNNEQVKQFAQKMIDDHTKLGDEMKPVAQQIGVELPTKISKKDQKTMAKLQGLSGTAYDQAYIRDMVKDHKQDLSEFQSEASNGQDPAVKNAANQGSQVIAQHLQMIQQLARDQNLTMAGQ
jgi:putative membrane protein